MLKYSPFFDHELFGAHMKSWRRQHRLSFRAMEQMTGYSNASLSRLENGIQQPDAGFLLALCYIMGLNIWDYFTPSERVTKIHERFAPKF